MPARSAIIAITIKENFKHHRDFFLFEKNWLRYLVNV